MRQDLETLRLKLASVVEAMGYEAVGVELQAQPQRRLLRIYIDRENGVNLEDCQRVSHQVSGVLEVEDWIDGPYTLEVSSPGLDRPLFEARHFDRFAGAMACVRLRQPLEGRRTLQGRLLGLRDGDVVIIDETGREWRMPLAAIEKARLAPEFPRGMAARKASAETKRHAR